MSWRGIHFDLKEGHLEGHLVLNEASLPLWESYEVTFLNNNFIMTL